MKLLLEFVGTLSIATHQPYLQNDYKRKGKLHHGDIERCGDYTRKYLRIIQSNWNDLQIVVIMDVCDGTE